MSSDRSLFSVEHDFAPATTTKDLPSPQELLDFHQQDYLAPLRHVISDEPTRCVLVVPTHGRGYQSIKDTCNGKPHGGFSATLLPRDLAASVAAELNSARKFRVVALELLSIGIYVPLSGSTTDGEPYIVRLESTDDAKAYMEALPFCYVAAAFAKEDAPKIVASNWNDFVMNPQTASHASRNYGLGGKGQIGRIDEDAAVTTVISSRGGGFNNKDNNNSGSKIKGNIRFTAEPRLSAKIYSRAQTSAARFAPEKAWVARPSTTDTWLSHNRED
jgi:hypothetical protein